MDTEYLDSSGDDKFDAKSGGFDFAMQPKIAIKLSESREMVMVPYGISYIIRTLTEKKPCFCWQYVGQSVLVHYHFNLADIPENHNSAQSKRPNATMPVFYGCIRHSFSPIEFAVQPKPLSRTRELLTKRINAAYSDESIQFFDREDIFEGLPCVTRDNLDGKWHRACIKSGTSDSMDVLVRFVDWGNEQYVKLDSLRPLYKRFGKLPPLALRCRMKGIDINDLVVTKVAEFQQMISDLNGLVRVELCTVEEPFLVNLYHPTLADTNLGTPFYSRPMDEQQIAKQERSYLPKRDRWPEKELGNKKRANDDNDTYSSSEEVAAHLEPHILHFERLPKPIPSFCNLIFIAHIENSRFIYVNTESQLKWIDTTEKIMTDKWDIFDAFPDRVLIRGNACTFKLPNGRVVRCYVDDLNAKNMVLIRSIDHGWKVFVPRADISGHLRALHRDYSSQPRMWLIRLAGSCQHYPHLSETEILRNILPIGQALTYKLERRSHGPPFKMTLFKDGVDVFDLLQEFKDELRVTHPCKDIVRYNVENVRFLGFEFDEDYEEEVFCPQSLAKGRMSFTDLSKCA